MMVSKKELIKIKKQLKTVQDFLLIDEPKMDLKDHEESIIAFNNLHQQLKEVEAEIEKYKQLKEVEAEIEKYKKLKKFENSLRKHF